MKVDNKSTLEQSNQTAEPAQDQLALLAGEPTHSLRLGARLRGYFLTGLIVVGPMAITLYVVWWFINLVDAWVKPLIPAAYLPETYLPFNVPGVGLIVGVLGVMAMGALTANLFGRTLVSQGEMMLDRMPVVRGVYRLFKQIFQTVFSKSGTSFKRVGLIEFPGVGSIASSFSPAIRRWKWLTRSAPAIRSSPRSCRTVRTPPPALSCSCRQARSSRSNLRSRTRSS